MLGKFSCVRRINVHVIVFRTELIEMMQKNGSQWMAVTFINVGGERVAEK